MFSHTLPDRRVSTHDDGGGKDNRRDGGRIEEKKD